MQRPVLMRGRAPSPAKRLRTAPGSVAIEHAVAPGATAGIAGIRLWSPAACSGNPPRDNTASLHATVYCFSPCSYWVER